MTDKVEILKALDRGMNEVLLIRLPGGTEKDHD
jgi:hypothetical protein